MARKEKFDYFDAYEKMSELAVKEADLLIEVIENFTTAEELKDAMSRAHELEHQGDEVNHAIFNDAAKTFMPPFDREDILSLAASFDEVLDCIEDVIMRMYMYDIHIMHENALPFAKLIRKSCKALNKSMGDFRNFRKSKKFHAYIVDVNTYEEEADKLLLESLRQLHTVDRDNPMRVHVWSQLYERFEKAADSCEHVADVMSAVVLKNV